VTESWVGGDIGGLRAMGLAYTGAKEELEAVIKPLDGVVDHLVSDTGWKGDAAKEFRAKWTEDALTAGAFAELCHATGGVLTTLAHQLSEAEGALQNAEDIAVRAGAPVLARGVPGRMVTANPPSAEDTKTIKALNEYVTVYNEAMHRAQQARLDAADKLQQLFTEDTEAVSKGDKATIADYLRGLYAYDSERTRAKGHDAADKLDDAKREADQAKKDLRAERKAYDKAGKALPKDLPAKGAYRDAKLRLEGLETDIARGEHGSSALPYDHLLNVKVADAAKALQLGEGLEKMPDFLREIPVVDVAAAGFCGLVEAGEDHDKGWSWTHSVTVDGGAALGGLAAGAAATAGGVALAASAEITVPVAVVAGGGGAVVIGATDLLDETFHEHWSEDIHDHGVVGGLLHGASNVGSDTGDDMKRLGSDAAGAAKGAWNGFKGLF